MARSADLSVVIVSLVGGEALARCIERLPLTEVDVVVVLKDATVDAALWTRRYPRVRFLAGRDEPVPVRRRRGIEAAASPLVGIIEDTSWPERGWCDAAVAAFADRKVVAASGPVQMAAFLSDKCRALAWIEFGSFARDNRARIASEQVPGNAMAFRRAELLTALAADAGLYEDAVCWRLRDRGGTIADVAGMAVTYSACSAEAASLTARFHHGRVSGAAQPAKTFGARMRAAGRALASAFSRTTRDIRRVSRADRASVSLLLILWLALMEAAWSAGAARGAIAGGGDKAKALR